MKNDFRGVFTSFLVSKREVDSRVSSKLENRKLENRK